MAYPVFTYAGNFSAVASQTTINVAYPSTINANDILILQVFGYATTSFTTPTGWTEIDTIQQDDKTFSLFWKRASGSESGSETVSCADSCDLFGHIYAFSNCAVSVTPYESYTYNAATSNSLTIPSISTNGIERLAVAFYNVCGYLNPTLTTNYTEIASVGSRTGQDGVMEAHLQEIATASTVSADNSTIGNVKTHVEHVLALIPVTVGNDLITASISNNSLISADLKAKGKLLSNINNNSVVDSNLSYVSSVTNFDSNNINISSFISANLKAKGKLSSNINNSTVVVSNLSYVSSVTNFDNNNINVSSFISADLKAKGKLLSTINNSTFVVSKLSYVSSVTNFESNNINVSSFLSADLKAKGKLLSTIINSTVVVSNLSYVSSVVNFDSNNINVSSFISADLKAKGKLLSVINNNSIVASNLSYISSSSNFKSTNINAASYIYVNLKAKGKLSSNINSNSVATAIFPYINVFIELVKSNSFITTNISANSSVTTNVTANSDVTTNISANSHLN